MSRLHTALALAAAMSCLLLFVQLQHVLDGNPLHRGPLSSSIATVCQWLIPTTPALFEQHDGTGTSHDSLGDEYLIGVGKADITGPVVEINFMGYADPKQTGTGLRQRLYSRVFIVGSADNVEERVVYAVLDTQSGDTAIRNGILEGLKEMGPDFAMYNQHNVAITGTHSHSGPGAWLNYLLPQITSKGFDRQSYEAIVKGTLLSIKRAHDSLTLGTLWSGKTEVLDANVNRSPYAYLANPEQERQNYEHDVDKNLDYIVFRRASDGVDVGVLTWFAVHGTSMLGNNTLVTGDNKGVAAYLFEKQAGAGFVAGFSQANVGDTSPNTLGAYCEDGTGQKCSFEASLCGGRNEACHGRGPFFGLDDAGTKSCFEIGRRQYEGAWNAYQSNDTVRVSGPIRSAHTFRDFGNYSFVHPNGSTVRTCSAALGFSFAAGTTDGPGAFDFKQNSSGDANASPLWKVVRNALHTPSEEQKACQAPKPILLDVGATTTPYQWTPNIVDIQMFRVGQVFMIISPGEATTMSGRRWKAAVTDLLEPLGVAKASDNVQIVLGGPANSYTHYIATEEEYAVQRYEGASTLYGPHTLNAYIAESLLLLPYLSMEQPTRPLDPGPSPPINTNRSLSFINPVIMDGHGFFHSFGDVLEDVDRVYSRGDRVHARFVAANPRNNLRLEGTFAAIERITANGREVVRDDADWDLVFEWKRTSTVQGTSEATVTWELTDEVEGGEYVIVYHGDARSLGSSVLAPFEGRSSVFLVE